MKYILIALLSITILGCATNKHDVSIAKSKFEYGEAVNAQNKVFEVTCDQAQKDSGKCGIFGELVVYQSNQRYVDVDPQRKDWVDYSFGLAQVLLPSILQYKIADSGNKYAFKSLESTNNMFSGIVSNVSTLKGSGTTYTDSNNDYSSTSNSTSSIADSNNSADYSYADSGNTSSGDTLSDSYNTSSTQKSSTESNTTAKQGDTTNTSTTSTTEIVPEVATTP